MCQQTAGQTTEEGERTEMEVCNNNDFLKTLCGGQDFSQALLCLDCWRRFLGEVMDETLGYKVVSLVSVGAGMTQDTESIWAAKPLLVYFWEQFIYRQSLANQLFTFLFFCWRVEHNY